MVDPFTKLRPKSTRRSEADEWLIPYSRDSGPSRLTDSDIGASPHAPPSKQSALMSYLHSPLSLPSGNNGPNRTYRFPSTIPAKAFPQRPLATQLQTPGQHNDHAASLSGMRLPTDSSVPTGLAAQKLLFSPLAREARQRPSDNPDPLDPSADWVGSRARTVSAPARSSRHRRQDSETKHWMTPTVCDRLVFPRPALTPLVITPPTSPGRAETDDRSSFLSRDDWGVVEDGKRRLREREGWADYVHRGGRSMSFGDQKARPGAPIIGNARIRSKEHEKRQSMEQDGGRRRNSISSLFRRYSSRERPTIHPSASEEDVRRPNRLPRLSQMSSTRYADRAGPQTAGEDFFPAKYPSHRYGGLRGLRGHTHTRSSPDLSQIARESMAEPLPPLPSGPPPRTLRLQHPRTSERVRNNEEGVIVIGPGTSAYRAPPVNPRRPTNLEAFSTARSGNSFTGEPSFRQRAPRPLDLSVTVSPHPSSLPPLTASQRSSSANIYKALPDLPTGNQSPTLELAPFSDLSAEVGKAMSPEMRSVSGFSPARQTPGRGRHEGDRDSAVTYRTPPSYRSEAMSPARDTLLSPARALLVKQHQIAKTRKAFASPAAQPRNGSIGSQKPAHKRNERASWHSNPVPAHLPAPLHNTGPISPPAPIALDDTSPSRAAALPLTASGQRKQTALEEIVNRRRAGSVSTTEEQAPLAKVSPSRDREETPELGRNAAILPSRALPALEMSESSWITPSRDNRGIPILAPPVFSPSPQAATPVAATHVAGRDFLSIPLPPDPPNMLRTDTSTTAQSKATIYTSASEGWNRDLESGMTTPTADYTHPFDQQGTLSSRGHDNVEESHHGERLMARTPENPRDNSPDNTPSPSHMMDDRDFAGLFFRTPKDASDSFPSPEISSDSIMGDRLGSLDQGNAGLGIELPSLANRSDAVLTSPVRQQDLRRPSDASAGTNGTGGTGKTSGTHGTGLTAHTEITTPVMRDHDVAIRSSGDSHSIPHSAESIRRSEVADAAVQVRQKTANDKSTATAPGPPIPPFRNEAPHSPENPLTGNRRDEGLISITPSSSISNLPPALSPGTFGAPTPRKERAGYFGHKSNLSGASTQSVLTTQSHRSAHSGSTGTPIRPPRPPSPGLESHRHSPDTGKVITFSRTGKTISPIHSPFSSPRFASRPSTADQPILSAVPSFVAEFPAPPSPSSPSSAKFPATFTTPPRTSSLAAFIDSLAHLDQPDSTTSHSDTLRALGLGTSSATEVSEFGSTPDSASRPVMSGAISSPSTPSRQGKRHGIAFGQVIIGPPGAGKSTYAHGMQQFLTALGRPCHVVNLDPATPSPSYPCSVNITDLISLESVMREYGLGPNGAMLYVAEYLEANLDWLVDRLDELLLQEGTLVPGYVIFDTPGQVELWTNHDSFKRVIERLTKMDHRLVAVHLSDAHYITDASKFISVALLALRATLQLELPHVNVLSKIDLLSTYGELPFDLRYYTECRDLEYLLDSLDIDTRPNPKMKALNRAMVELVEQYGAVHFETLAVEDKRSMLKLVRIIDQAIGYVSLPGSVSTLGDTTLNEKASHVGGDFLRNMPTLDDLGDVDDVQERWGARKAQHDEEEMEAWGREWEMRRAASGKEYGEGDGAAAEKDEEEESDADEQVFRGMERAMPLSGMAAQVVRPSAAHDD